MISRPTQDLQREQESRSKVAQISRGIVIINGISSRSRTFPRLHSMGVVALYSLWLGITIARRYFFRLLCISVEKHRTTYRKPLKHFLTMALSLSMGVVVLYFRWLGIMIVRKYSSHRFYISAERRRRTCRKPLKPSKMIRLTGWTMR